MARENVLKKKEEEEKTDFNKVLDEIYSRASKLIKEGKTTKPGYLAELTNIAIAKKTPVKTGGEVSFASIVKKEVPTKREDAITSAMNLGSILEDAATKGTAPNMKRWVKEGK
ncbi:hypothetical protein H0O02_02510 [Candidatus Micrarchaeota archaeon]|nr:hypothetical protein [Candidatus Micrarchaeota archaeon]